MTCKNCGSELYFENGAAVCKSCNSRYAIEQVFEDVDVHICYLESDSYGRRTKDSMIAQELYQKLEAKKIHVFYERVSAANVYGDALEQLRYSAIHAATVVLVIGTSVDNFNALLEKYGHFFEQKAIVPIISDIKPSDLPKNLSKFQALDHASIGWEKDLESGIFRLLGRENEADIFEVHHKAKRFRAWLMSVVAVGALAIVGALLLLYFGEKKGSEALVPTPVSVPTSVPTPVTLTKQNIYDDAQNFANEGNYLEALGLYAGIAGYKDSEHRIRSILDRYDGYYQTPDGRFSIYFNIKNTNELWLEMKTVSENGTAKATVQGVWEGTEGAYSFTDNLANPGDVKIALNNDGISIVVQMENDGDSASVGNQAVDFQLADKTDKPAVMQVTTELLMSWLQNPTTVEDITALGFEFTKDYDSFLITDIGKYSNSSFVYRIIDTDVQVLFYDRDLTDQEYFHRAHPSQTPIVCAVLAPAEYLIPNKLNTELRPFVNNDIFFVPGGEKIYLHQTIPKNSDYCILFYYNSPSGSFGSYLYSPPTSEIIYSNTLVGAISKEIIGRDSFIRNVLLQTTNNYRMGAIEMAEETEDYYIFKDEDIFYDEPYYYYKIDKRTYQLLETLEQGYTSVWCPECQERFLIKADTDTVLYCQTCGCRWLPRCDICGIRDAASIHIEGTDYFQCTICKQKWNPNSTMEEQEESTDSATEESEFVPGFY